MSFNIIERERIFWKSKRTTPIPNSIAEKTKKKNVKDSTFKLSKNKPINKTITYNVIQSNSAVNKRWRAEFVLIKTLKMSKKNKINSKFKSPINI